MTDRLLSVLAPLLLVPSASAQEVFQVRADELVLADGSRLTDALLVVRDGKVASVSQDELDPALPWIRHEGVVTAGLVACQSTLGVGGEGYDNARTLLPEAHVLHAFRPERSELDEALAAGITTVVLVPDARNLAGGHTAVVKTAGGTVLAEEAHLALSLTGAALSDAGLNFAQFFGSADDVGAAEDLHVTETATEDGGPELTDRGRRGTRPPTSYAGMLRTLEERFEAPDGPFARAKAGELPVHVTAWDRNEVARAVRFLRAQELRGLLRGAPLAGDPTLVPLLAESGLGVVLGPFVLGQATRSLESVRALHEAGVPVGFALGEPAESFRLGAAMAIAAGAEPREVLRSMTSVGARLAGVERRVGSLEPGRDADFVLWSGDPLDLSSAVVAVYVDGESAWTSEDE